MSSRMRITKGATGNRRSHHGLVMPRLSICSNCKEHHERHRLCLACGFYRNKEVIIVKKKEDLVQTAEEKKTDKTNEKIKKAEKI